MLLFLNTFICLESDLCRYPIWSRVPASPAQEERARLLPRKIRAKKKVRIIKTQNIIIKILNKKVKIRERVAIVRSKQENG